MLYAGWDVSCSGRGIPQTMGAHVQYTGSREERSSERGTERMSAERGVQTGSLGDSEQCLQATCASPPEPTQRQPAQQDDCTYPID